MVTANSITFQFTNEEITRFWSKVAIYWPRACWLWKAAKCNNGYGSFSTRSREFRTHRIAYYLHYGTDPQQLLVIHSCDVRACCNPIHLRLGTQQDNMDDCTLRGRRNWPKGILNGNHKHHILKGDLIKR